LRTYKASAWQAIATDAPLPIVDFEDPWTSAEL
jgi:hypothetical protein